VVNEARFHVPKMDCATEKEVIARRLASIEGIDRVEFDLLDRVVIVKHRDGGDVPAAVEAALGDIDMAPTRLDGGARPRTDHDHDHDHDQGLDHDRARPAQERAPTVLGMRREYLLLAVSGACALGAEVVAWTTGSEQNLAVILLSLLALVSGGLKTLRKGIVAARTLTLNINLLMMIAVVGALAIQEWPEAAMVTFLFACAEVIEAKSVDRARDAIRSLMVLAPDLTHVRRGEQWVETETATIERGATIRVRPGERVPLDGTVTAGTTSIDQAPITGESMPVDKAIGDKVFAGSVNQQGMIEVEVTAGAGDTTLARIARTIREAQSQQAPTERFVDRFARWYTPAVVLLAVGFVAVPTLAFGEPFQPWLYKALVLLVIACPCALVISTPVTIVSGLAAAAKLGLLVKGGVYLEQARNLRVIAVDKTGTITEGRPELTDVIPLAELSADEVLARAAALEATSTHPLAHAVVSGFSGVPPPASDVAAVEGKGIEGKVGAEHVGIGSHRFAHDRGVCSARVEEALALLERDGKSVMVVWRGESVLQVVGVIGVADTVRQTSIEAVQRLHAMGIRLLMLTGDNPTTAAAVAKQVGIDDVAADLLPEDKLSRIAELVEQTNVGMVGDGVNDAPALARASIGFAMGAVGSDTALETADVALMGDDLRGVPDLIALSRRTASTLKTNIAIAIAVKVVFFALALAGIATLWMAVFADMGASLIVATNGLRLLRAGTRINETRRGTPRIARRLE
jgi:Zn2+/Cd2+-exporting ATPase